MRLVCLPHAGGGTAAFHKWRRFLPPEITLIPLRLPGREDRFDEPTYSDLFTLARHGADAVAEIGDRPFVLFGHSLGSYVAWEITRTLRRRNQSLPEMLVVSASAAPHLAHLRPSICELSDDDFVTELARRYDGIPDLVQSDWALLRWMLPTLRADMRMLADYRPPDELPLDVETLVLGGAEDPGVSLADLNAWRQHTTGRFAVRVFPGGHFFLFRDSIAAPAAMQVITERLQAILVQR